MNRIKRMAEDDQRGEIQSQKDLHKYKIFLSTLALIIGATKESIAENHDQESEHSAELKGGPTMAIDDHDPAFGFSAHLSLIPDPSSHARPHFEITALDLGATFYKIPIRTTSPNPPKDLNGTEFHIGSMGNFVLPFGNIDLSLGAGLALGVLYRADAKIAVGSTYYYIPEKWQTTALAIFEGELTIHFSDRYITSLGYMPHYSLIPVSHEIPDFKQKHLDHVFGMSLGISL